MLDNFGPLAHPRVSGRRLFALKRIAEALEAGFLTLEECQKATARIDPGYVRVFDCKRSEAAERAAQVTRIIQLILQLRFPGRFRAELRRRS